MIVIDASVAVKWIAPEARHELARQLIGRPDLVAPSLLLIEVGNALARKTRDGEVTPEQAHIGILRTSQRVDLVATDHEIVARAFNMALVLAHPIYDCIYLALAEALGAPVLTDDDAFGGRATKAGFGSLVVPLSGYGGQ